MENNLNGLPDRLSNSLDPDQARHFAEFDLGPELFVTSISRTN